MFGEEFLIASLVASALASIGGTVASSQAQSAIRKKQQAAQVTEAAHQRDMIAGEISRYKTPCQTKRYKPSRKNRKPLPIRLSST
jgi:hypothetical protein